LFGLERYFEHMLSRRKNKRSFAGKRPAKTGQDGLGRFAKTEEMTCEKGKGKNAATWNAPIEFGQNPPGYTTSVSGFTEPAISHSMTAHDRGCQGIVHRRSSMRG
jgi:hypothetical protein